MVAWVSVLTKKWLPIPYKVHDSCGKRRTQINHKSLSTMAGSWTVLVRRNGQNNSSPFFVAKVVGKIAPGFHSDTRKIIIYIYLSMHFDHQSSWCRSDCWNWTWWYQHTWLKWCAWVWWWHGRYQWSMWQFRRRNKRMWFNLSWLASGLFCREHCWSLKISIVVQSFGWEKSSHLELEIIPVQRKVYRTQ
jgi:hypothetical protein